MPDSLFLIANLIGTVILFISTTILGWKLFGMDRRRKAELNPPHTNYNKPGGVELPDLHNWPNHPFEITTDTGTYFRWICSDCDSFVQKKKVD